MAWKAAIFALISFLLLSFRVSSNTFDPYVVEVSSASVPAKAPVHASTPAPVHAPTPAPVHAPKKAPAPAPVVHVLPPVNVTECPRLCGNRCRLHSRPRHCNRVCGTCCQRCKCVPPGTAGNKEMCGKCYTDMTTHGGRPKCP